MIKIFGNIRKKLISENRSIIRNTNYFKYALGEILLVVVGILIALQVNNWNEERKLIAYQNTMLKEVQKQLKSDYKMVCSSIPYIENIMHDIHELAAIKSNPEYPSDSLQYYMDQIKDFGIAVSFNTSAYESVKSGGLEKIRNPEIRNLLANLYGNSIPSATNWINEILRESLFKRFDLFNQMFKAKVLPGEGNTITTDLTINDPEMIRDRPEFDEMLRTLSWPLPVALRQLKNLKKQMENLDELLKQEVN